MIKRDFTINDAVYKSKGKHDECYTPKDFVERIVKFVPKNWTVWCPFDKEESNFVKVLKEKGYKVIFSHIETGQDFFKYEPKEHYDCIVSNPPFSNKREFFERAFQLGKPFMLLMTAQWFNDAAPVQLYMKYNKTMQTIQPVHRVNFIGGEGKIPFKSVFFCCDFPLEHDNELIDY